MTTAAPFDEGELAARPFLKWAGGKRQLLPELRARADEALRGRRTATNAARKAFVTYYEPFLGGGALFFSLKDAVRRGVIGGPARWALSDTNMRLIRTYKAVRDEVDGVIALLASYPYDRAFFEELRGADVDGQADVQVAAWMIYLNRTAFNGLYRVNRRGVFNVPFGRYQNPTICDEKNLYACSAALQGVSLRCLDFEDATAAARAGSFVYFDPPYVPVSATSDFTGYSAEGFGDAQQVRLRDCALRLREQHNARVLLSNSSAPRVRALYAARFQLTEVSAVRAINSIGAKRGAVAELLLE